MKNFILKIVFLVSCFQIKTANFKKNLEKQTGQCIHFEGLPNDMTGQGIIISIATRLSQPSSVLSNSEKLKEALDEVCCNTILASLQNVQVTINSSFPVIKIGYRANRSSNSHVIHTSLVRFFTHQLGAGWEKNVGSDWQVLKQEFDKKLFEYLKNYSSTSVIDITYGGHLFIQPSFEKFHRKLRKKSRKEKLEQNKNDIYEKIGNEYKGRFAVLSSEPA